MAPKNYLSIRRGRGYLLSGMMSPLFIFLFYFIFPFWDKPISNNEFVNYAFYATIQVGLLEECTKYFFFQWISTERKSTKYDLPIATISYSLMTAIGFAIAENISYMMSQYEKMTMLPFMTNTEVNNSLLNLAYQRSFTAVVMHMICGVIIGYFVYLGNKKQIIDQEYGKLKGSSKISKFKYILFGIIMAALFHGIYDLNLFLEDNNYKILFTVVIVTFGLVIGYFMLNRAIIDSKKIREEKKFKNESA